MYETTPAPTKAVMRFYPPVDNVLPVKPEPSPQRGLSSCILVVDDQPANIQSIGTVLSNLGHEIIPAPDGPAVFEHLASRTPDLILLDLLMPGMNGYDVCVRLKENPRWKDIPVVFLSAADDKEMIVQALNSGGVDYITKPFNRAELVSRVRTQLALKSARDHLRQLAEDKDELFGILAHDLKNHLGGMEMSARLLCNRISRLKEPDDRSLRLAENIFHSSGKLLAFVKELLANAAADYGFNLKPTVLNLKDVVMMAVGQFHEMARRKKMTFQTDFPATKIMVKADEAAAGQVLDNLISNALKFSPPGTLISISVRQRGDFGECLVHDQGPGFTPDDRERMFHRYGRLSARPTANEPSTGLGLSIVRKLVRAMSGEVSCENRQPNGAVFTVSLPCA